MRRRPRRNLTRACHGPARMGVSSCGPPLSRLRRSSVRPQHHSPSDPECGTVFVEPFRFVPPWLSAVDGTKLGVAHTAPHCYKCLFGPGFGIPIYAHSYSARGARRLKESSLHEPDGELRTGADAELVLDVLERLVDRPLLDFKPGPDLFARQPARDQNRDFELARGQGMGFSRRRLW